jgi:hypothetical protein
MSNVKIPALELDLPGAPATPHEIPGYEGTFEPGLPRPLDELGITLADAKRLDKHEGVPLRLVQITTKKEA